MSYRGTIKLVDAKSGDDHISMYYDSLPTLMTIFKEWEKSSLVQTRQMFIHVIRDIRPVNTQLEDTETHKTVVKEQLKQINKQDCIDFIRANLYKYKTREFAEKLDIPFMVASRYIREVKKTKPEKVIIRWDFAKPPAEEVKKPFVRPPSLYSNKNHFENL